MDNMKDIAPYENYTPERRNIEKWSQRSKYLIGAVALLSTAVIGLIIAVAILANNTENKTNDDATVAISFTSAALTVQSTEITQGSKKTTGYATDSTQSVTSTISGFTQSTFLTEITDSSQSMVFTLSGTVQTTNVISDVTESVEPTQTTVGIPTSTASVGTSSTTDTPIDVVANITQHTPSVKLEAGCDEIKTIQVCENVLKCGKNDTILLCPATMATEEVQVQCYGRQQTFLNNTKCDCVPCLNQKPIKRLVGSIYSADAAPVRYAEIFYNGTVLSTSNYFGSFSVEIPVTESGFVNLIFKAETFMDTSKTVDINVPTAKINITVEMLSVSKTVKVDTATTTIVEIGNETTSQPIATFDIPPHSVKDENGNYVSGEVVMSISAISTTNPTDLERTPGTFESVEGPLLSGGMFSVKANCPDDKTCSIEGVNIYTNSTTLTDLDLWFLNDESKWERVVPINKRRRKRDSAHIANVRITSDKIYNLDKVTNGRYWLVKVRLFDSENGEAKNEIHKGTLRASYLSVTGEWLAYQEIHLSQYPQCLNVPSNYDNSEVDTVVLSASIDGQPLKTIVNGSSAFNHTNTTFIISKQSIQNATPPFYSDYIDCDSSTFNEDHFKFYENLPSVLPEINVVTFDESGLSASSKQQQPLFWWPNPSEIVASYIKIRIDSYSTSPQHYLISSTSYGGSIKAIKNKYIGTRFANITSSSDYFGCVEFKSSGPVSNFSQQNNTDYTRVVIRVEDVDCYLKSVNSDLDKELTLLNRNKWEIFSPFFDMLAPEEGDVAERTGIYFQSILPVDPKEAKKRALLKCCNKNNVALTFQC